MALMEEVTSDWHLVAKTHETDEDEPMAVEVGDLFIAIFKIADTFYATDDICMHEFASLSEGFVDGNVIECPLHQARFHIPTGKVVGPPASEDLRTYPVKVVNEGIYVQVSAD